MSETKTAALVDWIDQLCDRVESARGVRIDARRRKSFLDVLQSRGYERWRRLTAEAWCLTGDWNRKKGPKTIEISDFYPTPEQLGTLELDVVPKRYHWLRLSEVKRQAEQATEERLRAELTPENLSILLEGVTAQLVAKEREVIEAQTDARKMTEAKASAELRISSLQKQVAGLTGQVERLAGSQAVAERIIIRYANDLFRRLGPDSVQLITTLPSWFLDETLLALPEADQTLIVDTIRSIEVFDQRETPLHDSGTVTVDGQRVHWRIRYRNRTNDGHMSPLMIRQCRRIMSIAAEPLEEEPTTVELERISDELPRIDGT